MILDDHEEIRAPPPISPAIDLIDFDYIYWHTADDTLEHISGDSLQKVGAVTLHYLRQALGQIAAEKRPQNFLPRKGWPPRSISAFILRSRFRPGLTPSEKHP